MTESFWPTRLNIPEDQWDKLTTPEKFFRGLQAFLENRHEIIYKLCGDFQQNVHKELIQHGFFVPQSSLSLGAVQKLAILLQDGNFREIRAFLCDQLRQELGKDHLFSLRKRWSQNPLFVNRKRFLNRGLEAHLHQDFISSIPILFPQVEGILVDFLEQTGVWETKPDDCTVALNLMRKILVEDDNEMIFTRGDKEAFQKFCDQRHIFHPRPEKNVFLNRGAILHGECLTYDKEEWSAQIIYFLDFLCNLTSCDWKHQELPDGSPTIQLRKRAQAKK